MTYLGGGARLHNRVGLVNCSGSYNETTISTALWIGCLNVVFPHTFFSKINYFCPRNGPSLLASQTTFNGRWSGYSETNSMHD